MGKKSSGVRWVGDAALIAENKAATQWEADGQSNQNPNPRSGESGAIGRFAGKRQGATSDFKKKNAAMKAGGKGSKSSKSQAAPPSGGKVPAKKKK